MNVLLISDCGVKYGASKSFKRLICNIRQIDPNINIYVLLSKKAEEISEELRSYGCIVEVVPFYSYIQDIPYSKSLIIPKYLIRGVEYLCGRIVGTILAKKRLNFSNIDIIHSNSVREDIGELLSKEYKIPLICHIREYGDIDFHSYSYRRNYIKLINNTCVRCLAVSESVRQHWIKKGLDADKVYTLYNGVGLGRKNENAVTKDSGNKISIIMVGSLIEAKGQIEMIEAINLLPDYIKKSITVDIFGDGRYRYFKRLKRLIDKYGLNKVIILKGYKKDVSEDIGNYAIGLNCSRAEAFGRVTAEYMMAGLAVIASNTGANPEIIKNGVSGLLYKQGDSKDLAQKIQYLIMHKDFLRDLAQRGKEEAISRFNERLSAENVIKQYYEIVSQK